MAIGKMPRRSVVPRPEHLPEAPLGHGNRLGSGTAEEARTRQGPTRTEHDEISRLAESRLDHSNVVGAWAAYERAMTLMAVDQTASGDLQLQYARAAGVALQEFGERHGNTEALLAAAAIFRRALGYDIDTGVTKVYLGNAIVRIAHQENSIELAREAQASFESALTELSSSANPAFFVRAKLNIIAASCLIAEYEKDLPLIDRCIADLQTLATELAATTSPDRARAETELGNAIMARHHLSPEPEHGLDEAVAAYRRAVTLSDDEFERAKYQIDLAAALSEADQSDEAIKICTDLSRILSLERFPLAWANMELVRADVLSTLGESDPQAESPQKYLDQAVHVYSGVLDAGSWPPAVRTKARIRLAGTLVLLSTRQTMAAAEDLLKQAISLYDDALPDLAPDDQLALRAGRDAVSEELNCRLSQYSDDINVEFTDPEYDNVISLESSPQPPDSKAVRPMTTLYEDFELFLGSHGIVSHSIRADLLRNILPIIEAARKTSDDASQAKPKWKTRGIDDLDLTPVQFIQKHYAAELAAGILHKGVIHSEDPDLYRGLFNWLSNPKNSLPDNFDLPTKSEWNTRRLPEIGLLKSSQSGKAGKQADPAARELIRLYEVAKKRAVRASQPPQPARRSRIRGPRA